MAMDKKTKAKNESLIFLLILAIIVVVINVLGNFAHVRADLTKQEIYSLSQGSKRLAQRLDDKLEIRAYFTPDLPYPYNGLERYTRDMLEEYASASNGKIRVRFIHPDAQSEEDKEAAERDGVRQVPTPDLREDRIGEVQAYRGISFHHLGESRSIPFLENTEGLEYEITQKIKDLLGDRNAVGIIKDHEGPTLEKGLASLKEVLSDRYDFQEISASSPISTELKAVLLVNPATPLSDEEIKNIENFVKSGGSLGVFGGTRKLPEALLDGAATPIDTGINKLLESWGVKINSDLIADAECGSVSAPTGIQGLNIPMRYPLLPEVHLEEKQASHPAMFRLNQVQMPFSSTVSVTDKAKSGLNKVIIAESSKNSWPLKGESIDLSPRQRWLPDATMKPRALAVAIEGKPAAAAMSTETGDNQASKKSRVLVVGSGFVLDDRIFPPADPRTGQRQMTNTLAFALNSLDWLSQDSDLIAIRAKNIEDPALRNPALEEAQGEVMEALQQQDQAEADKAFERLKKARSEWAWTKNAYRWLNTLGLPIAFALMGVVYWRSRKNKYLNYKL